MFKEYLKQYREIITDNNPNNGICFDGVVSEHFFSRDKRLMLLLKETNGNDNNGDRNDVLTDWNYMDWVYKQALQEEPLYRSVYRNIAMWSRMFNICIDEKRMPEVVELIDENGIIVDDKLCGSLLNVSIVNLKKSWGTESTDWNEMDKYLDNSQRREILKHQLSELKPTLVLCGGTFDFAKKVFVNDAEEKIKNGVRFFERESTIFANCYHPSRPGWSREDSFNHANNIFKTFLLDD